MSEILESTDIIDPWLYSTFSGDSTLAAVIGTRIINTLSAQKFATPYVAWDVASTRSIRGVGGTLLDTDSLVNIKAVTNESGFGQAAAIAARIRALIDKVAVTITLPFPASLTCYWDTEIRYAEPVEGVEYRHLGGAYRIRAIAL